MQRIVHERISVLASVVTIELGYFDKDLKEMPCTQGCLLGRFLTVLGLRFAFRTIVTGLKIGARTDKCDEKPWQLGSSPVLSESMYISSPLP